MQINLHVDPKQCQTFVNVVLPIHQLHRQYQATDNNNEHS